MEERVLSDRASRVKEVYEECGFRSVSEFARYTHLKQPTVANFMSGFRDPSDESIKRIHEALPKYSILWLLHGHGDKFNPGYMQADAPELKKKTEENNAMLNKLAGVYERLIEVLDKCKSLEQQLDEAKARIAELEKSKEDK